MFLSLYAPLSVSIGLSDMSVVWMDQATVLHCGCAHARAAPPSLHIPSPRAVPAAARMVCAQLRACIMDGWMNVVV